ncbi:hypothetical protein ACSQ67_015721 [Phaseolus vulgaris]
MATSTMDVLHFHHTPFYCEENVYLLCKKLCSDGIAKAEGSDLFVVFISNEKKQACSISSSGGCLTGQSNSGIGNNSLALTLQIECEGKTCQIFANIASIPLWNQKASKRADGVILWDYHVICIQLDIKVKHINCFLCYSRLFRVVHAPIFLRSFASDRRHMKDSGGKWVEEPPPHEPIVAEDGTVHNLNEYINMSVADAITDVTISSVKDVIFTQKNGVVIKDNQLEEFICQLSSLE